MKIRNKKFLVWGMGISGVSSLKLLKELGNQVICVNKGDVSSWENSKICLKLADYNYDENEVFNHIKLNEIDGVILTPGISLKNKNILIFKEAGVLIFGEIELGFQVIKDSEIPLVCVTGTNGKTTTVMLIHEILKSSGYQTFLGGNIGKPLCDFALDYLKYAKRVDVITLELSSFQLETLIDFKATSAAILNLSANHGERYLDFNDYVEAKLNIFNNMDRFAKKIIREKDIKLIKKQEANFSILNDHSFDNLKSLDLSKYSLVGKHNLINLNFSLELLKDLPSILNITNSSIEKALLNFEGIPHRLYKIKTRKSVNVFNDAKSTNWDATKTAISSIKDEFIGQKIRLILGGKLRGENDGISALMPEILNHSLFLYLFAESGKSISNELIELGYKDFILFETLNEIVKFDKENFTEGILLFSPAFPSFDQFLNYKERGELFIDLIQNEIF